jgi:hypothetical protein
MKATREGDRMNIDRSKDISAGYNVSSLPTQVLIDPSGKIIARYGEAASAHEELDKNLSEAFKGIATIRFTGTTDPIYDGEEVVIYNRAIGVHDSAMVQNGRFVILLKRQGSNSSLQRTTKANASWIKWKVLR